MAQPDLLTRDATEGAGAPILELRDVHAAYGRIQVLHGINLVVPPHSVVALLGPNGAGKTTTLKVASGLHPASSGCVHVLGYHVNGARPEELARSGICLIPEGRGIFPNLSVRENLEMMTYAAPPDTDVAGRAFEQFPVLAERRTQLAGTLSGGEQQMLAIARALATEPRLLMLDEISMGLAPIIVAGLYDLVAEIAAGGVAVLVVEQYARMALRVCDYAAVMVHGRVRSVGEAADIEGELSTAYLGGAS